MIDGSGIALQDRQKIRGRGRETGGEKVEGERERWGGKEGARFRKTELGGKIEMSNYQMMAVDSMGMLGKFSVRAPKQSTAVLCLVYFCI